MRTLREQIDLMGEVVWVQGDERVVRICLPEVILEGDLAVKEGQPVVILRMAPQGAATVRETSF